MFLSTSASAAGTMTPSSVTPRPPRSERTVAVASLLSGYSVRYTVYEVITIPERSILHRTNPFLSVLIRMRGTSPPVLRTGLAAMLLI